MSYEYNCVIERVIDGDTIEASIDLGFDVWLRKQKIRLAFRDAPERRTRDVREKAVGIYATTLVERAFPPGSKAELKSMKFERGKYGRIIGDLIHASERHSWSITLLAAGLSITQGQDKAFKLRHWHHQYHVLAAAGKIKPVNWEAE